MRTDRVVWLQPGWRGRYRVAAGGLPWWGSHMTWQADRGGGFRSGRSGEGSCQEEKRMQVGCVHTSLGQH